MQLLQMRQLHFQANIFEFKQILTKFEFKQISNNMLDICLNSKTKQSHSFTVTVGLMKRVTFINQQL